MSVESDLRTHLLADTAVAALVVARIYPMKAATGATKPFITYFKSQTTSLGTLDDPDKVQRHTMTIESWGTTYQSAKDTAEAVTAALDGLMDTWAAGDVSVRLNDMSDTYDEDAALYTVTSEVTILQR